MVGATTGAPSTLWPMGTLGPTLRQICSGPSSRLCRNGIFSPGSLVLIYEQLLLLELTTGLFHSLLAGFKVLDTCNSHVLYPAYLLQLEFGEHLPRDLYEVWPVSTLSGRSSGVRASAPLHRGCLG